MSLSLDRKTLEEFDRKLIQDLRNSLETSGSNASGKTSKSLNSKISGDRYQLFGRPFIYTLEYGRGKSKSGSGGLLKAAILQWIKDKPVIPKDGMTKETLAFLITRKIHKEGNLLFRTGKNYKGYNRPTEIINGVINDGRISELSKRLILDYVSAIKNEIEWQQQ